MTTPVGLVELSLRGVGVIDAAALEFGPGLTVVTGETGAGKTMILTGLALVLGGASDSGLVRQGHSQAVVEARFGLDDSEVHAIVTECGASVDEDGSVLLARSIAAEGRSRAHLGGRTVPAATLAQLGSRLVAVHGQDDQHRLMRPSQQRAALDRFGGATVSEKIEGYRAVYEQLLQARRQHDEVAGHERERALEAAELRDVVEVIERVDPQPGEDDDLRAESQRWSHLEEIVRLVDSARSSMDAADPATVSELLARAAQRDDSIGELRDRSARLSAEWTELGVDLSRYLSDLSADPARAEQVESRRAALSDLRRRIERTGWWPDLVGEPSAWGSRAKERLDELGDDAGLVAQLASRITELTTDLAACAQRLRAARQAAASDLGAAVTAELSALAMPGARITVEVRPRDAGAADIDLVVDGHVCGADRHGTDIVEFLLSSRDGAPARPIARSASGGERSRVMLALEVVFAASDTVPTFVFDEVDAGIGGKAAVEVGHRLALLARHAQVLVVTHLPQVAAFADRHLVVRPGAVTASSIDTVTGEARVTELARMLAGLEESETAAAHATELLAVAAERTAGRSG